jgi:hypothetical protein
MCALGAELSAKRQSLNLLRASARLICLPGGWLSRFDVNAYWDTGIQEYVSELARRRVGKVAAELFSKTACSEAL